VRPSILVICLVASLSIAQENTSQKLIFRSESNVVIVPTLVKNVKGELVYGLQAKDFVIEDDGIEQVAQLDEAAESQPISLVIAIQTGRRATREFGRMRGLKSVLEPVLSNPHVESAILFFDSHLDLALDFTNNSEAVAQRLKTLTPGDGGAATLDAVDFSVKLLSKQPEERRRVLLLISETRDHGSHWARRIEEVVAHVGNSNLVVYALAFSPSKSQVLDTLRGTNRDEGRATADVLAAVALTTNAMRRNIPKTVASMTGGEYGLFATLNGFETQMTAFDNHLYNRYLLSFQPKNPRPGLHQIRVRLREPGKGSVMARTNYWASGNWHEPMTSK
jgi:VWFA-related protein